MRMVSEKWQGSENTLKPGMQGWVFPGVDALQKCSGCDFWVVWQLEVYLTEAVTNCFSGWPAQLALLTCTRLGSAAISPAFHV